MGCCPPPALSAEWWGFLSPKPWVSFAHDLLKRQWLNLKGMLLCWRQWQPFRGAGFTAGHSGYTKIHQGFEHFLTPPHTWSWWLQELLLIPHSTTAVSSQHLSLCTCVESSPKLWQILDKRTIWNAFFSLCLFTARDKCVWMIFIHSWE